MSSFSQKQPAKYKVSSRDVAHAAGVSQSTVSRVFSGRQLSMISDATREKVLKVAAEMGYKPNPVAQALRGSRSNLLGVIVREIADPFFSKLIAQLTIHARSSGYHIVLGHAGSDPVEALELKSHLDMGHTDGVILVGDLKDDEILLNNLLEQNRPVLALCRGPSPAALHTINTDNHQGIFTLMDYLFQLGHRRFGFINGGWAGDIRERLNAYREYISSRELTFHPDWIQTDVNTAEGGYRATSRLLEVPERPTALLASDDEMAAGVIRRLIDAKIQIPEEISVTGFDNIDIGQYLIPSLTTMNQPIEELSRQAMDAIIRMIDDSESKETQIVQRIVPGLVLRESTGPAPKRTGD